ncbi:MAG: glycosyltransferase family 2 protein, partial [Clostridia bacterium]|nr:glycosyltransferase family 2 protein [Clostridia bacterium]
IGTVIGGLSFYKTAYFLIGLFFTRKFKKAKNNHKYAIVIAARNEESVIGNLLNSIDKQDYPKELLTVFVVADNCVDKTAEIARQNGAVCYERFDSEHRTKGYALQFLFERIEEDYGTDSFEGYFVFDADNLLKRDYITRMNEAFDAGEKIITSYRNTKNFDESWVASTYAIHWLFSIRLRHRPRSVLRLATNIQGTGFLFSNEIVKNGWKYTSLTEDRALTVDAVAQGYSISYNDAAEFYDEQPTDLKIALRQRLRWARGHLLAFVETGPYLFLNVIFGKHFIKTRWGEKETKSPKKKTCKERWLAILESIRHRWASYDTLIQLTPFVILNIARWLIVTVILYAFASYCEGVKNMDVFSQNYWLGRWIYYLFPVNITVGKGMKAFIFAIVIQVWRRIIVRINNGIERISAAIYIFIAERKRIIKMPLRKKILYCLTWPAYDLIERFTKCIAVFKRVEWKPIPHKSKVTIDDLHGDEANGNPSLIKK